MKSHFELASADGFGGEGICKCTCIACLDITRAKV